MESEFIALNKVGEEAEWLRNFLEDILYWPKPVAPVCIHYDNQVAIGRAEIMMYNGKSRHIRWRYYTIRELLSSGIITIDYVKSKDNVSDPLTKGLSREGEERTSKEMSLRPRTSQHSGHLLLSTLQFLNTIHSQSLWLVLFTHYNWSFNLQPVGDDLDVDGCGVAVRGGVGVKEVLAVLGLRLPNLNRSIIYISESSSGGLFRSLFCSTSASTVAPCLANLNMGFIASRINPRLVIFFD
ncbi:hypothetical protein T459_30548 [Capsicum annuum]|uniref:Reverse transcriptase Ty1/copia-type domain-containing protein n=1 Tax=Capsicum annuum TaxID=4072 RepID=A0A2G2Y8N2_CAPAN|nr:hypothetical protein T459_30548 [Capsicum annuum]